MTSVSKAILPRYSVFVKKIGTWNAFENVIYIDSLNQKILFCENGGQDRVSVHCTIM